MVLQSLTKSPRASRNTLLVSLVIIGAIAAHNWLITPHLKFLEAAQKYEVTANRHARKNAMISNEVAAKKDELAQLREGLKTDSRRLFDPLTAKEFFDGIETIAQETKCTVHSLHFAVTSVAGEVDRLATTNRLTEDHASLSATGGYGQIVALVRKLQGRPEQVTVDMLKIKPVADNSGLLTCDMRVRIYVIKKGETDSHD